MSVETKSIWGVIKPVFVIVILAICAIMFFFGIKEPGIKLVDDQIQIKGLYGSKIDVADVENITLLDKSMKDIGIGTRTNGFGGFGSTLKGNFKSAGLGKHILFVNSNSAPTIWIERNDDPDIYISLNDSQSTKDLFLELSEKIIQ